MSREQERKPAKRTGIGQGMQILRSTSEGPNEAWEVLAVTEWTQCHRLNPVYLGFFSLSRDLRPYLEEAGDNKKGSCFRRTAHPTSFKARTRPMPPAGDRRAEPPDSFRISRVLDALLPSRV